MKDAFYFQHDYSARNDPKLQEVLIEHGAMGLGVFWCIIEQLYEQGGQLSLRSCKSIAFALHVDCKVVESVVQDFDLFKTDGTSFWSNSVIARLDRRKEVSERRRKAAETRWKSKETQQEQCNSNANAQQEQCNVYPKERKEKEIKESTSIEVECIKAKRTAFVPPTLEEVNAYVSEKGYIVDADRFVDYYTSNGWMVGKNKMKDWQAAVRSWARKSQSTTTPAPYVAPTIHRQPPADFHEQRRSEIARQVAQGLAATTSS